jgi:hypothetical protein
MGISILRKLGVTAAFLATLYSGCFEQEKLTPEQDIRTKRDSKTELRVLNQIIQGEVDKIYSFLLNYEINETCGVKVLLDEGDYFVQRKVQEEGTKYPICGETVRISLRPSIRGLEEGTVFITKYSHSGWSKRLETRYDFNGDGIDAADIRPQTILDDDSQEGLAQLVETNRDYLNILTQVTGRLQNRYHKKKWNQEIHIFPRI